MRLIEKGCGEAKRKAAIVPLLVNLIFLLPVHIIFSFMSKSDRNILAEYLPEESVDSILTLIHDHQINLNIKKSRATKLGDFREPTQGNPARLSINSDLNSYAFLITLVHEIAHYLVWENYKNYRSLQPHGIEWKRTFQGLMNPYLTAEIFPDKLLIILQKHMQNPKASSSSDVKLTQAIKEYDEGEKQTILADLAIGDSFLFRDKQFQIIKKNRSRFLCTEKISQSQYLIHSLAEISPLG